jgi:hypothetical protein
VTIFDLAFIALFLISIGTLAFAAIPRSWASALGPSSSLNPKHSDLAEQIRSLRQLTHQSGSIKPAGSNKSDSAKDAQTARLKQRVRALEERVQSLQQENELLYGKLSSMRVMGEPARASSASEVP